MQQVTEDLRKSHIKLIALLTTAFATVLSTSMVRIAAPYIQEVFDLRYGNLTWIHNAYQISYAILLPVFGQMGDRFGRRKILLYGLALFGIGSIFCGISWSLLSLSVFRIIQGIGAAAIFPNALVLATEDFPKNRRGRAMGIWAMGVSLGSVTGPTLGGLIIQFFGWRYTFFVNILFLIISLISIIILVKRSEVVKSDQHETSFDYRGTIVLAVMITTLVTAMVNGPEIGWTNLLVAVPFAIWALSMPLFKKIENKHKNPLVDPKMLKNRIFLTGVLCGGVHLVAIQGTNFLMPLFLSQVHHVDALSIGLIMLPQAAIRLVMSPVAGFLSDRFGDRLPVTIGLVVRTAAMASLAMLTPQSSIIVIAIGLVLDGTGASLIWAPSLNAAIESCPDEMAGSATGVFNMLRFVMGTVGTVIVGIILDIFFTSAPQTGPVLGFFHAYILLGTLTIIGLTQVKHLEPQSEKDSRQPI